MHVFNRLAVVNYFYILTLKGFIGIYWFFIVMDALVLLLERTSLDYFLENSVVVLFRFLLYSVFFGTFT